MGKPRIQPTISFVISFIPAWAGKTRSIDSRQDSKHSSSPLTQGKLSQCNRQRLLARLIPAHAGKTLRGCGRGGLRGAHPRSRGENMVIRGAWYRLIGSSPLTRGKLGARRAEIERVRLIPAHAGKTSASSQSSRQRTAHPRSRGENCVVQVLVAASAGSSPLTRGKPWEIVCLGIAIGLIPAHAGKTRQFPVEAQSGSAHPRSRGENHSLALSAPYPTGSSPLTRGKRRLRCRGAGVAGLIPAHAGKTRSSSLTNSLKPAHPRSRGENASPNAGATPPDGSSPLTRGKPKERAMPVMITRLIPAHAGKTRV